MENITVETSSYFPNSRMNKGYPKIVKKGVVSPYGESTPFVWHGRLYRLELVDVTRGAVSPAQAIGHIHFIIRDAETGAVVSRFGYGHYYCAAYVENERVYVTAIRIDPTSGWYGGDTVILFETEDLVHWSERVLLRREGWRYFNTSIVHDGEKYVMLMESNLPEEAAGAHPFTFFFAVSPDLVQWEFLPAGTGYPWKRYGGGPKLHWCNGYYYLISVTGIHDMIYTNFIYRTKDLLHWEVGKYNPFLMPSNEDMTVAENAVEITPELAAEIAVHYNCNNSDVDFCEFGGKTVINYNTGDQLGFYNIAEAEYDGSIQQLLENFFD